MADVSPSRKNVQIEEVRYKSSVSEATGFKLGGAINFINDRQYDTKRFDLNGPYSINVIEGLKLGVDGAQPVLHNCEIVGVCMFNIVAGSSGTTELDIRKYTASNTPSGGTSIFFTRPAISYTAGNYAYVFYRFQDSTTLENPAGTTLPALTSPNLDAGDLLVVDIVQAQEGAQNCGLVLFTRPR
jgi:hypothetical protein